MAYIGPKVRLSRRIGIALTPKAGRYLERRPYPPGHHGTRRATKPSPYKLRLLEKQKLRYQYDVPEGQLRRVVEEGWTAAAIGCVPGRFSASVRRAERCRAFGAGSRRRRRRTSRST